MFSSTTNLNAKPRELVIFISSEVKVLTEQGTLLRFFKFTFIIIYQVHWKENGIENWWLRKGELFGHISSSNIIFKNILWR
jgi:hypothetical protein